MAYCWLVKVAATEVAAAETAEMVAMVAMVATVETEAEGKEMGPEQHPAMGQVLVMDQVKVLMNRGPVTGPAIKSASMSPERA